jgi:hypothetical protein
MRLHKIANLLRLASWQFGQNETTLRPNCDKLQKPCRSYRRIRRAAAAVEFAVVAPVFFLMIFGMVEYGRMVMVQQVLTNASREGARLAVIDGSDCADVEAHVESYLTNAAIDLTGVVVTVTPDPPDSAGFGEPITVSVSIPFSEVSWLPTPMYLGGETLTATTVMRRESNP